MNMEVQMPIGTGWMVLEVPTCLFFVRGKKCPLVFICGKKCPLVFCLLMVKALFAWDYPPESVLLFSHGNRVFLSQQINPINQPYKSAATGPKSCIQWTDALNVSTYFWFTTNEWREWSHSASACMLVRFLCFIECIHLLHLPIAVVECIDGCRLWGISSRP